MTSSVEAGEAKPRSLLLDILISWFPMLLLIGVWIFFMRQMQGGGSGRGAMSFGKSKARLMGEDQIKVTFNDVAGVEEAKEEVSELVEFLRDPGKFQKLGGKIPRGVLMVGSPGTGKTLLLKQLQAKLKFHSLLFLVRTLLRCLSVLVLHVCAICLRKRKNMRHVLSLLMRLMQ